MCKNKAFLVQSLYSRGLIDISCLCCLLVSNTIGFDIQYEDIERDRNVEADLHNSSICRATQGGDLTRNASSWTSLLGSSPSDTSRLLKFHQGHQEL